MDRKRRPVWLGAINYYVIAIAACAAFFFFVWGLLEDVELRSPWQTAGISASIILIGSVILREVILRRRAAYVRQPPPRVNDSSKLTASRVTAIMGEIGRRSDAANVLENVASGHRQVFELCGSFIARVDAELANVQPGSPRLAALLKGRSKAIDLHRFHTLRWAEIESKSLSADAKTLPDATARVRAARQAVDVVDQALVSYPAESSLTASRELLAELALSIEVANAVEQAEEAVVRGDTVSARSFYREALYLLGSDAVRSPERERAAERIHSAMERLSFTSENG